MLTLRPYQENIISIVKDLWGKRKTKILVTAPTGAGKTIVFSELVRRTTENNRKAFIFTNRTELLTQAGGSLAKIGIKTFNVQAGTNYVSTDFNAYVGMAQTVRRRIEQVYWIEFFKTIDLFIIDECHLSDFDFLFESGIFEGKHVLGFTATPKRSGKMRQLGLDYEEIVETVTVKELIALGYLNDCDYYGCDVPDMGNVAYDRMKGDYQEKAMFNAYNSAKLYAGVVRNWKNICPDTKTLVFCCNIQHCIKTCQEFVDNGINAKYVVSDVSKPKYPSKNDEGTMAIYNEKMEAYELYCKTFLTMSGDRDTLFKDFKNGDITVLINAGIATTGFDEPSIETIVINRATMSLSLWLQMLGRGSRLFEGKTHFNILDFGDNQSRLGTYSEDREWGLWHEESKGGGVAPLKRCGFDSMDRPLYGEHHPKRSDLFNKDKLDGCGRLVHAGLTICPFCGFKSLAKELKDVDLQTIYLDGGTNEYRRAKPISKMEDSELKDYCKAKGHNIAWLWRQIYMRGGMQRIDNQDWSEKSKESAKKYCQRFA